MINLGEKSHVIFRIMASILILSLIIALAGCNLFPEKAVVFFISNGGSYVPSKVVEIGSTISEPETPERVGYNFEGWYIDSAFTETWNFSTNTVEQPMVLYANWIEHWIKEVIAGDIQTMIIKSDGTAWGAGYNFYGELGIGTNLDTSPPAQVMTEAYVPIHDIGSVSTGLYHTLFLKTDGSMNAVGHNMYGQFGDGTTDISYYPVHSLVYNIKKISAGYYHSVILKNDGSLWATGRNDSGQLGDSTTTNRYSPVEVMANPFTPISDVTMVAAGGYFTMILKEDGTLWGVGNNEFGQLGDGTNTVRANPIQVKQLIDSEIIEMTGVAKVFAGGFHTIILKQDGTLWAVGHNNNGQLGDGTNTGRLYPVQVMIDENTPMTDVATVSAGHFHTMILKNDGTLWGTGDNYHGQLGDETNDDKFYPVEVMTNVAAVSAGGYHTMIVKKDGTLWAVGSNTYGQLGDGETENQNLPIEISEP